MNKKRSLIGIGAVIFTLLTVVACGNKASFEVVSSTEATSGPGFYSMPPKVDIAVFMSTRGSMISVLPTVNPDIQNFLSILDSEGWDYHFVMTSLDTPQTPTRIACSVYDGNSTNWQPPYPGASRASSSVVSNYYSSASNYTNYMSGSASNGLEAGLDTINTFYKSSFGVQSGFSRPDAMSVIFVVSNGNDTSKVNYCPRNDGSMAPCEQADTAHPLCTANANDPTGGSTTCGSDASSLAYYQRNLLAVKSNLKFFAAVPESGEATCLNENAQTGTRYMEMASRLGGAYFDLCTQSLGAVLTDLTLSLAAVQQSYKTQELFISQAANPSTIVVTKAINGDPGNVVIIPQSTTQGWNYEGQVTNVPVIYSVAPNGAKTYMNTASGYGIHLYGSAVLSGSDTASVQYMPAGANNAVSQ